LDSDKYLERISKLESQGKWQDTIDAAKGTVEYNKKAKTFFLKPRLKLLLSAKILPVNSRHQNSFTPVAFRTKY
jgi:hypothetical protein